MTETPRSDDNAAASTAPLITSGLITPSAAADKKTSRTRVLSWALWDWGSASFNAVITTFVFTVYLTSTPAFGGTDYVSAQLGWWIGGAGLIIALFAPITGQRSDGSGRRKLWLGVNTYIVVLISALLFFVEPKPGLLVLGLFLIAAGTVFFEFASVNYNAMLHQVSTPKSIGKISGFGWAMGYFGGIVLLLILYFGFIHPDVGLFGVTDADGLSVRVSMLIAAAWFGIFALPLLFKVPEFRIPAEKQARVGFFRSYAILGRDIAKLWRTNRPTLGFLIASAIFRDGLTGVFTFGGVLAAGTFGFSSGDVIIFAIAANVVAGLSTLLVGQLDDRVGPKPVMVTALVGTVLAAIAIFVFHAGGTTIFWIFGLAMCLFVGPAQSASRSFLSRIVPAARQGEMFGLYATTGKAATFLAPTAFAIFVTAFGAQIWGVLGIALVLFVGLLLLLPVSAKLADHRVDGEAMESVTNESRSNPREPREPRSKPRRFGFVGATLLILAITSTVAQLIALQVFVPDWSLAPRETGWSTGGVVALIGALYMGAKCRTWEDFKRRIGALIGIMAVLAFAAVYLASSL